VPRPSNAAERRAQIVQGLLEVMASQGYEAASVGSIARAAGLATGLVHYHFSSKLDVLLALIRHLAEGVEARLAVRLAEEAAPRERVRAWVRVHLALGPDADPRAVACWVAVAAEAVRLPAVRRELRAFLEREVDALARLVSDALEAEGRSTRGARSIAAALLSTVLGYFQLASTVPELVPRGSAAPAVSDMADALLTAAPRKTTRHRK
jgi:TetR/AcrR family transcriptional repressor of bet genes